MAKEKVGQAARSKVKPERKRSDAGNNKKGTGKGSGKGNGKDKITRKKRKGGRRRENRRSRTTRSR